jgi:hypothetical protein
MQKWRITIVYVKIPRLDQDQEAVWQLSTMAASCMSTFLSAVSYVYLASLLRFFMLIKNEIIGLANFQKIQVIWMDKLAGNICKNKKSAWLSL